MKAKDFEKKHQQEWYLYEQMMQNVEKGKTENVDVAKVPSMVRARSNELALARHRMYGVRMCEDLNQKVMRGHQTLARKQGGGMEKVVRFFAVDFPRAMRREWKLLVLSTLFFLIPFFAMWWGYEHNEEWVYSILDENGRRALDASYGKGESNLADMRGEDGANFRMFGHYINNNIGIDLLIIAGGALAGIGSLFFLFFNGLAMGSAFAYVLAEGDPEKLFSFVSGHAPYELLGMIVAGMAGMKIGLAMLKPGRLTIGRALMESGKQGLPLIIGACALTFFAAIIEGFWSAEPVAPSIKYMVGYSGWLALAIYFIFAGRRLDESR